MTPLRAPYDRNAACQFRRLASMLAGHWFG
jgi:hypothetical protein